jgi:hypothetical protein
MRRRLLLWLSPVVLAAAGFTAFVRHLDMPAARALEQSARIALVKVGDIVYHSDASEARELAKKNYVGRVPETIIPFVFERADAPHLVAFRNKYELGKVIEGPGGEYDAMLRLAAWVGSQYQHGTDPVPGGNYVCDSVAVIEAGRRGASFWCEIAARTMAHAAAAVGWPARVITTSSDGYTWEHAVTELWSTEHDKWFVIDTDFNVVFEHGGVPLSAFELAHKGPELRRSDQLTVRRFAAFKQGLVPQDLLRFFDYVHVDMRTDWCSRPLRRGSPAGGDKSTWWTARPGRGPKLSPSLRVDDIAAFDWPLNRVIFEPTINVNGTANSSGSVQLSTYAPAFSRFEYRLGSGDWTTSTEGRIDLPKLPQGTRASIEARVVTSTESRGPEAAFEIVAQ